MIEFKQKEDIPTKIASLFNTSKRKSLTRFIANSLGTNKSIKQFTFIVLWLKFQSIEFCNRINDDGAIGIKAVMIFQLRVCGILFWCNAIDPKWI